MQVAKSAKSKDQKQHCWECRRRQLVCDSTRPGCTRCFKNGVSCPGYGPSKPLQFKWLPPGKVKSRNPKSRKNLTNNAPGPNKAESPNDVVSVIANSPSTEISTLAHMLVEAAEYYNSQIGPSIQPMLDITPNFGVPVISPIIFQNGLSYPDHTRLVLACTSLSHRMCHDSEQTTALSHKFFYCRGLIINSLRDDINSKNKGTSNFVIAGILTLLLLDVRQGISHTSWRYHLDAIRKVIKLRGGFRIFSESPGALGLLHSFMAFAILGDTSSPASQLSMNEDYIKDLYFIMDHYADTMDLFRVIPAPLFVSIIKINHLRIRAAYHSHRADLTPEAYELLCTILGFSTEDWALSKSVIQKDDLTVIGNIYKASTALYCISSLQSLSILPVTLFLKNNIIDMTQVLKQQLAYALSSEKFLRLLLWPLVVLGVMAREEKAMREFVQKGLLNLRDYTGIYTPQIALGVLEEFWASKRGSWDDCFREPYMFWSLQGIESRGLWKASRG